MSMSNAKVVEKFGKGAIKGKSSRMFIEDDTLYDYGHHFPLLVRMPFGLLMNADKYSSTTSAHQAIASRIATIMIPFSVFHLAEINYRNIELIDKTDERWDHVRYYKFCENLDASGKHKVTVLDAEVKDTTEDQRIEAGIYEDTERRPSACIIKYEGKFYLSSMDGNNYFLSQLPCSVSTVKDAFVCLRPKECFDVSGKVRSDILRQGEWFFIPIDDFRTTLKGFPIQRQFELLPQAGGTGHHTATECRMLLNIPYVRGTVRHSRRDHRMLKLGKVWHMAIESNHVRSWGANGRVD